MICSTPKLSFLESDAVVLNIHIITLFSDKAANLYKFFLMRRLIILQQVLHSKQGDLIKERNRAQIVPVSLLALAIAFGITYCVVRLVFEVVVR